MDYLEWMARGGHERLCALQDGPSGLRAWLAIHDSSCGPAYGGIRIRRYRREAEAVQDVLRLSRAMTFKCALADVPGGGAKTVVLADHLNDRRRAMERLGEFIEELDGRYRCGPDVGFVESDRLALCSATRWYAHRREKLRPAGEATAEGAEWGIRAAVQHVLGRDSLAGITVAVQGLGSVGGALARRLLAAGARVIGADPDPEACEAARRAGVELVDPGAIYDQEVDVFAPCALGGTLHEVSVARLRARLVAGCANNVLARAEHAELLHRRGAVFVPDFVLNAGALIEGAGHDATGRTEFGPELRRIGDTVLRVLRRAEAGGTTPLQAALELAREILESRRRAAGGAAPADRAAPVD